MAMLDYREKDGYTRSNVTVHTVHQVAINAITYIADETNPNFLGPTPIDQLARIINSASGPSGSNNEYILTLDNTLKQLCINDDHVSELAASVDHHRSK